MNDSILPELADDEKLAIAVGLGVQILGPRPKGGWHITCPGAGAHSKAELDNSQVAKLDFHPAQGHQWCDCFHDGGSCTQYRLELNSRISSEIRKEQWRRVGKDSHGGELRIALPKSTGSKATIFSPTSKQTERKARLAAAAALKAKSQTNLARILREHACTVDQFITRSPTPYTDGDYVADWRKFLSLFDGDDVLWVGDVRETGRKGHRNWFRTARQWGEIPGPLDGSNFTSPFTFFPGTYSRCKAQVAERKFLILEGDDVLDAYTLRDATGKKIESPEPTESQKAANRDACASVIFFLSRFFKLRMVVDAGNKSLHGWYDWPRGVEYDDLLPRMLGLNMDPCCSRLSQPCRVPGAIRENRKHQRVLWFAGL